MQAQLKYPQEQKVLDYINATDQFEFGSSNASDMRTMIVDYEKTQRWSNMRFYRTMLAISEIQSLVGY